MLRCKTAVGTPVALLLSAVKHFPVFVALLLPLVGCSEPIKEYVLHPGDTISISSSVSVDAQERITRAVDMWNETGATHLQVCIGCEGNWSIDDSGVPPGEYAGFTHHDERRISLDLVRTPVEYLTAVTAHELGHALGISVHEQTGIMAPQFGAIPPTCIDEQALTDLTAVGLHGHTTCK